jgi:hypothetical protein
MFSGRRLMREHKEYTVNAKMAAKRFYKRVGVLRASHI